MVEKSHIMQVVMYAMFRPGDIVRAKVLSLGDSRSYILSTASPLLGVVSAKSLAGSFLLVIKSLCLPTVCLIAVKSLSRGGDGAHQLARDAMPADARCGKAKSCQARVQVSGEPNQ